MNYRLHVCAYLYVHIYFFSLAEVLIVIVYYNNDLRGCVVLGYKSYCMKHIISLTIGFVKFLVYYYMHGILALSST